MEYPTQADMAKTIAEMALRLEKLEARVEDLEEALDDAQERRGYGADRAALPLRDLEREMVGRQRAAETERWVQEERLRKLEQRQRRGW
jgi:hypothetical protein